MIFVLIMQGFQVFVCNMISTECVGYVEIVIGPLLVRFSCPQWKKSEEETMVSGKMSDQNHCKVVRPGDIQCTLFFLSN